MKKLNFVIFLAAAFTVFSCETTKKEPETIQSLIRQGKFEEAKSFFTTKSDINEQDLDGNTVLHAAALMNDADLVTFLIIKGANTEIKNFESQTPLILAIDNDCFDSARSLINAKANIFARDSEGVTALEKGLSINETYYEMMISSTTAAIKDDQGRTIIHYFVNDRNEVALDYAIKRKLPIDDIDDEGHSPLALALSDPDSIEDARMANMLLLAGAKPIGGKTAYFENAVLSRNYSVTMTDGQTPLHIAAIKNHTGISEFLIKNNADTSSQDINGSTPLHEACRYGNTEIARLLLDAKADVNSQDSLCKTPLLLIIPEESRTEIYKLLIEYKADVNHRDMYGDTIFHTAAMTNLNTDILELLFSSGADVNIRNKKGNTALSTAVEHNLKDQIKFYVNHGADIHAEDSAHTTPYIRVLNSTDGMFEAMINSSNINSVDSEGNTPLLIAIQKDAPVSKIRYLIQSGSNVNARNREGNSALYYAVQNNSREIGKLLLEKDANIFSANTKEISPLKLALTGEGNDWLINSNTITSTDGSGNTVLHYAADWKLTKAVKYLVQKGAKIDARNANGQTPLFNAAKSDSAAIISALLTSGADINTRDQLGSTPLHAAVRWNALKSAAKLIDCGLDVNSQNVSGKTPLAEASVEGNTEMAQLLLSRGANPNIYDSAGRTSLVDAIKANQLESVSLLLKNGANPQIQDMNGRTPYHEAAENANIDIITLLRKARSNPLNRDKEGNTPLSIAFTKDSSIINAVLGTDKNITDSDGNTPVHIAITCKAGSKILSSLIEKGYPFDTRNSSGFTPLALAVMANETDETNTLIEYGASPFAELNTRGETVLTVAFKENNSEMLGYIVKYSGKKTDIKGNTILHYAARFADRATVTRLLSLGLDKTVKNYAGERPYDIAISWKNQKIADLLK
ncbi:MAG: ankyrin repeat domain-containing protein [Treponema sp.]|uniref:ankyrin repeat domain-containing protein n=1 Tax=Treponema sp. TaxID=166 RepID=UPI00298EB02B|nr:ankyrin repeat domain-containing protein [Treponema sp.]MCR5387401.1 ankyrin repeat domain-containing protein [Treponema sp.]